MNLHRKIRTTQNSYDAWPTRGLPHMSMITICHRIKILSESFFSYSFYTRLCLDFLWFQDFRQYRFQDINIFTRLIQNNVTNLAAPVYSYVLYQKKTPTNSGKIVLFIQLYLLFGCGTMPTSTMLVFFTVSFLRNWYVCNENDSDKSLQ